MCLSLKPASPFCLISASQKIFLCLSDFACKTGTVILKEKLSGLNKPHKCRATKPSRMLFYSNSSPFEGPLQSSFPPHSLCVVTDDIHVANSKSVPSFPYLAQFITPSDLITSFPFFSNTTLSWPPHFTGHIPTLNLLSYLTNQGKVEATCWRWWHQKMEGAQASEYVENNLLLPLMTYTGKEINLYYVKLAWWGGCLL